MSKSRQRAIKLRKVLKDNLHEKYRLGKGTPKLNKVHNGTPTIHSHNTYHTYLQCVDRFADWCKDRGIKSLEDARESVPAYIQERIDQGKSPHTVAKDLSGIAKAMNCQTTDLGVQLPHRNREGIKNNRGVAERSKSFNENQYKVLVNFIRACGLRRTELSRVKGSALQCARDGRVYVRIARGDGSKGGKCRYAEIAGEHRVLAVSMMMKAGDNLVFPSGIPKQVNTHHYRGDYAKMLYQQYARDIRTLPAHELYICRGTMKGMKYDRKALEIVSKCLGHNRVDVVVNNYFY